MVYLAAKEKITLLILIKTLNMKDSHIELNWKLVRREKSNLCFCVALCEQSSKEVSVSINTCTLKRFLIHGYGRDTGKVLSLATTTLLLIVEPPELKGSLLSHRNTTAPNWVTTAQCTASPNWATTSPFILKATVQQPLTLLDVTLQRHNTKNF